MRPSRQPGITIGNPPKYLGYEDELHKVIRISKKKERNRALLYECLCKSCNGIHLRNAKHLKQKMQGKDCPNFRPHNWSGFSREDAIMRRQYGISLNEFEGLLQYQEGCCAICKKPIDALNRRANIDHCHQTGEVRGLLCTGCNTSLGRLGDTIEGLRRALDYLENPPFATYARAR